MEVSSKIAPEEKAPSETRAVGITAPMSESARQAFQVAQAIERRLEHTELYSEVLLIALNEEAGSPTRSLLEAFGLDRNRVWIGLAQRQHWSHPVPIDYVTDELSGQEIGPLCNNTSNILDIAWQIAQNQGADRVRTRHLLAALLESDQCVANQWLVEMGTPVAAARDILAKVPESTAVTPGMFAYAAGSAFSDAATDQDALGFEMYTRALAEIIIKPETVPPLVVGVYGPWGSGKSTFLSLVKRFLSEWDEEHYPRDFLGRLRQNLKRLASRDETQALPRVACVEFNAWAYNDAAKLWAGLVKQIAARLDQEIAWWQRPLYWLRRSGWRFLGAVILSLIPLMLALVSMFFQSLWSWAEDQELVVRIAAWVIASGSSTLFFSQQTPLTNIVSSLVKKTDVSEVEGVMHRIQEELKTTIRDYFGLSEVSGTSDRQVLKRARQKKLKLVVFIDELDRCPLEKIVDILEAIKLFLAEEIFIVLMAVDTRVVAEAIHLHYIDVKNPDLAREYIEKIVQVPIRVPEADRSKLGQFVDGLMSVPQEESDEGKPPVVSTQTSASPVPPSEPVTRGPLRVSSEPLKPLLLPDTKDERDAISNFASDYLESNPRRIKRLLNTYRYVKILATRRGERTDLEKWQKKMVNWLGLTMRWPSFMEMVIEKLRSSPTFSPDQLRADQRPPDKVFKILLPDDREILKFAEMADNFIVENPPRGPAKPPQSGPDEQPDTNQKGASNGSKL